MFDLPLLTASQDSMLKVNLAISRLRAGLPVIIEDIVIFSAETVNHKILDCLLLHKVNLSVLISKYRAKFLFDIDVDHDLELDFIIGKSFLDEILLSVKKMSKTDYIIRKARINAVYALNLIKLAGLLPSLLILKTNIINGHDILQLLPEDIKAYSKNISESLVEVTRAKIELYHAQNSYFVTFRSNESAIEHYAIIVGEVEQMSNPIVRVHSSCFTGDVIGSLYCDCGAQLQSAIKYLNDNGGGIILYLMQEGRNIGLSNKLRAYNLQRLGYDTVDANEILGFAKDERDYYAASVMLKHFGVNKIKLLSNNPQKAVELQKYDIVISEMINHTANIHQHNLCYLRTKVAKMGHTIDSNLLEGNYE